MKRICHYCGEVKSVIPVDRLIMLQDPNRPEFICHECVDEMEVYLGNVDKYLEKLLKPKIKSNEELLKIEKRYKEWWKLQKYKNEPVVTDYDYVLMCNGRIPQSKL